MAESIRDLLQSLMGDSFNPFEEVVVAAEEVNPQGERKLLGVVDENGEEIDPSQLSPGVRQALMGMGLFPAEEEAPIETIRVRVSILSGDIGVEAEQTLDIGMAHLGIPFKEALLLTASKAVADAVIKAEKLGV